MDPITRQHKNFRRWCRMLAERRAVDFFGVPTDDQINMVEAALVESANKAMKLVMNMFDRDKQLKQALAKL